MEQFIWRIQTEEAEFKYLMKEKNKQTKMSDLKYEKLEMQEYLNDRNRNARISKLIFVMCNVFH